MVETYLIESLKIKTYCIFPLCERNVKIDWNLYEVFPPSFAGYETISSCCRIITLLKLFILNANVTMIMILTFHIFFITWHYYNVSSFIFSFSPKVSIENTQCMCLLLLIYTYNSNPRIMLLHCLYNPLSKEVYSRYYLWKGLLCKYKVY